MIWSTHPVTAVPVVGVVAGGGTRKLDFLREHPRATHEDFGAYDRAMAAERRTAILVTPAHVYRNR